MFGDSRGDGDQSKEQPFNSITSQRFGQLLVGLVAEVNARRIAKRIVGGFKIDGEFATVQLIHVGHQHEG